MLWLISIPVSGFGEWQTKGIKRGMPEMKFTKTSEIQKDTERV